MAEPGRIKELTEGELSAEQKEVLKALGAGRGRAPTPYKMWIHAPGLASALEKVGTYLNTGGSLKPREIELLKCTIANHWKGEYLWTMHARNGLKQGLPQAVFDAIRNGQTPPLEDERERAIYDLAEIAMAPGAGPDEVFSRVERVLGRNGIAEVLAMLGYYSSVAMGLKLHRVPVPA